MSGSRELIHEADILEATCEIEVENVKDLVLRNGRFTDFDEGVSKRLLQIRTLSLSNNKFTTLSEKFQRFQNLTCRLSVLILMCVWSLKISPILCLKLFEKLAIVLLHIHIVRSLQVSIHAISPAIVSLLV